MKFGKSIFVNYAPLLLLILIIAISNAVVPFPDCNDFGGLSRICLLMDRDWRYCITNNWGFALPLLNFLLSSITNNLLISQRILSTAMLVGFVIVGDLVLSKPFSKSLTLHKLIAIAAALPWIIEASISTHLDIAGLFLLSLALYVATYKHTFTGLLLAGLIASTSYWFRFHFLGLAFLFPVVALPLLPANIRNVRSILYLYIGAGVGILVPHILCMMVYGTLSLSNQKTVLAQLAGMVDWSIASQKSIESFSYKEILSRISIGGSLKKSFVSFLRILPHLLLLTTLAWVGSSDRKPFRCFSKLHKPPFLITVSIILFSFAGIFPFVALRGSFPDRIQLCVLGFWFLLLPFLFKYPGKRVRMAAIVCALLLSAVLTARKADTLLTYRRNMCDISRTIESYIPIQVLQHKPFTVFSSAEYYNRHHRYLLTNPVIIGGWYVRFDPFLNHFGTFDLGSNAQNAHYKIDYYVLQKDPVQSFQKYDAALLDANRTLYEDSLLLILQLPPKSQSSRPEARGLSRLMGSSAEY